MLFPFQTKYTQRCPDSIYKARSKQVSKYTKETLHCLSADVEKRSMYKPIVSCFLLPTRQILSSAILFPFMMADSWYRRTSKVLQLREGRIEQGHAQCLFESMGLRGSRARAGSVLSLPAMSHLMILCHTWDFTACLNVTEHATSLQVGERLRQLLALY